ncbi:MAG: LemA family protein [Chitinophagaceae bacterium]|jgi:LemA protein|nr:LemA family protein [Sphingobacteriales bacterium]OJV97375.1 MAG: LemA family protein [Sphingobacteriales bacterium 44-61]TXJ23413.1 MAG: LemA family protein [Chitinophagaceae bacterium]
MKGTKNLGWLILIGLILILGVWGCSGYNGLVKQDEVVKNTWNNVNTEYQKRADLVDNLVNTVKGAANFEKETLTGLVEARAKATSVNFTADQLTPENMAKFQQAQSQMSGALSRLLAVVENYPDLKANQNFLQLQGQLEGIENDVRGSRRTFNDAINTYNTKVRSFPTNIFAGMFGFKAKEGFKADEGAEKAPKVQF